MAESASVLVAGLNGQPTELALLRFVSEHEGPNGGDSPQPTVICDTFFEVVHTRVDISGSYPLLNVVLRVKPSVPMAPGTNTSAQKSNATIPKDAVHPVGTLTAHDHYATNEGPGGYTALIGSSGWAHEKNLSQVLTRSPIALIGQFCAATCNNAEVDIPHLACSLADSTGYGTNNPTPPLRGKFRDYYGYRVAFLPISELEVGTRAAFWVDPLEGETPLDYAYLSYASQPSLFSGPFEVRVDGLPRLQVTDHGVRGGLSAVPQFYAESSTLVLDALGGMQPIASVEACAVFLPEVTTEHAGGMTTLLNVGDHPITIQRGATFAAHLGQDQVLPPGGALQVGAPFVGMRWRQIAPVSENS